MTTIAANDWLATGSLVAVITTVRSQSYLRYARVISANRIHLVLDSGLHLRRTTDGRWLAIDSPHDRTIRALPVNDPQVQLLVAEKAAANAYQQVVEATDDTRRAGIANTTSEHAANLAKAVQRWAAAIATRDQARSDFYAEERQVS